mmetsp:Transcript_9879/g.14749  ORF Transcript_9879/g.14749 Transcript_9879/m.14749 type:complete len:370 (-) Transcript_9879:136-1245(-)
MTLDGRMDMQPLNDETRFVIRALFSQLAAWADLESAARLARKDTAAADRLREVGGFKLRLVGCLHRRLADRGLTRLDTHGGSYHGSVDPRDRGLLLRVRDLFPFVDPITEPALLECSAAFLSPSPSGGAGSLVLTARHLLFSTHPAATSALFPFNLKLLPSAPDLRVIPLRTIASISCEGGGRVYDFTSVNGGPSSRPAVLPACCLGITDVSGNSDALIELRHHTVADMAARVADLIDVIVQGKLHQDPHTPAEVALTTNPTAEVVPAASSSSPLPSGILVSSTSPNPIPPHTVSVSVSVDPSPLPSPSEASTPERGQHGEARPKKSLAANIQKFLQKSQAQSGRDPPPPPLQSPLKEVETRDIQEQSS